MKAGSVTGKEDQKRLLKQYLSQYYKARKKKKQLETRLQTFREEMVGVSGKQFYYNAPTSKSNKVGQGAATPVIRVAEIEERIDKQKKEMTAAMLNVMKIMDFLPIDSTERSILEYRHLDCLEWKQVCREASLTRTPCNNYYNAGVEKLLAFKKVQKILQEFQESVEVTRPKSGARVRQART